MEPALTAVERAAYPGVHTAQEPDDGEGPVRTDRAF